MAAHDHVYAPGTDRPLEATPPLGGYLPIVGAVVAAARRRGATAVGGPWRDVALMTVGTAKFSGTSPSIRSESSLIPMLAPMATSWGGGVARSVHDGSG